MLNAGWNRSPNHSPERPQRSVSEMYEGDIDCPCEDACVKVANVKSVKRNVYKGTLQKCPKEHPACPNLLRRSDEAR